MASRGKATAKKTSAKRTTAATGSRSRKQGSSTSGRKGTTKKKGVVSRVVESVSNIFSGNGQVDAIELLTKDHRRVDELFSKVKANEDGNNKDVFTKIRAELDLHAHIEEQIFYPFLLENGDEELQKIVREGLEEHAQVKTLLPEIAALSGDSDDFKAKLTVLMENVEHHVEEEEGEMFSMVRDQVESEMLVRLGSLLEAEKARSGGASRTASAG